MKRILFPILLFVLLSIVTNELRAQETLNLLNIPEESPRASVSWRVGITEITVKYHSPSVKGRKIWGTNLVPYDGRPFPWRAGANENTTISFEHAVRINGTELGAGTYGFHIIPFAEKEWILVLSKNSNSWGSFSYQQAEDAMRITAKPTENIFTEWLRYEFINATDSAVDISMAWEKLRVGFTVQVPVNKIVSKSLANQLQNTIIGFSWLGHFYAARYLYNSNVNLPEALLYINRSISGGANYSNLSVKSKILDKLGKTKEAEDTLKLALSVAVPTELNSYAVALLQEKKADKALEVFQLNAKNHPDFVMVTGGLARGYSGTGNYKEALKYAKQALGKATSPSAKTFWEGAIKKLENNQDMN